MIKILSCVAVLLLLCLLAYRQGQSECELKTVVKERRKIEYVLQKKAEIYAEPNAGRDSLLKLMYSGIL